MMSSCVFSTSLESSYLKLSDSMPNNPDKITLLFNWFPSLLRCSLQSTSGKQIWLLGNLFLEVGRLGVGGRCFRKEGGRNAAWNSAGNGWGGQDICKIYIYVLVSNTKIEKNCDHSLIINEGRRGRLGRNRQILQGIPLLSSWIIHSLSYTCMN